MAGVGARPRRGGAERRATRQTPRQGKKTQELSSLKGGIAAEADQCARDLLCQNECVERGESTLQSCAVA